MTWENEAESRWRNYFCQLLNGGEMRGIGDGESRKKERVSERIR